VLSDSYTSCSCRRFSFTKRSFNLPWAFYFFLTLKLFPSLRILIWCVSEIKRKASHQNAEDSGQESQGVIKVCTLSSPKQNTRFNLLFFFSFLYHALTLSITPVKILQKLTWKVRLVCVIFSLLTMDLLKCYFRRSCAEYRRDNGSAYPLLLWRVPETAHIYARWHTCNCRAYSGILVKGFGNLLLKFNMENFWCVFFLLNLKCTRLNEKPTSVQLRNCKKEIALSKSLVMMFADTQSLLLQISLLETRTLRAFFVPFLVNFSQILSNIIFSEFPFYMMTAYRFHFYYGWSTWVPIWSTSKGYCPSFSKFGMEGRQNQQASKKSLEESVIDWL